MTHADATATQAVERYLLGELSTEERDQFEAHAFDCTVCADDLKSAALFLAASRSELREHPPEMSWTGETPSPAAPSAAGPAATHGWRAWLGLGPFPSYGLASAFLVLLAFTSYQTFVTLPALKNSSAPRALSAFSFVSSGTRGATAMVIAAPARQPFLLFFDIPPGGGYASYRCDVVAADGTRQLGVEVSAAQARDTVQMFVPAGALSTGPHTLVITGAGAETGAEAKREIARYPFVLQGGS